MVDVARPDAIVRSGYRMIDEECYAELCFIVRTATLISSSSGDIRHVSIPHSRRARRSWVCEFRACFQAPGKPIVAGGRSNSRSVDSCVGEYSSLSDRTDNLAGLPLQPWCESNCCVDREVHIRSARTEARVS